MLYNPIQLEEEDLRLELQLVRPLLPPCLPPARSLRSGRNYHE